MSVAISATTRAQQQPPFRSGANYVRVDVYPTASGRPVQDLTASDFQLFEDGKPQKIEAFEHVSTQTARPAVPEPGSAEASRRVAGPGRGRVFVVFLDAAHVTSQGSGKIAEPLIGLLDAVIGAEDLVGVMTSDMTASQVVLGRKIDVFARGLRDNPVWGRRYDRTKFDERERKYDECYPMVRQEMANGRLMSELAQSLIERRRERRTFDALNDLVAYLGSAGDTRKTVFTITEGWMLFRPDQQLLEPRYRNPDDAATREPVPGKKGVTIRDGKLTTDDPSNLNSLRYSCDADRLSLANLDDEQYLKDIIGDANRHNASFYTIDPRGLAVFNADINWDRPSTEALPVTRDGANLRSAHGAMRTLSAETDGFAVLDSNDLEKGMRRIADDLSSYYLLGYYSTNTRPDGKFREITVRVIRPGVDVRARRGYRAPTPDELTATASTPSAVATTPASAVASAIASLSSIESASRLRINASSFADQSTQTVWITGELLRSPADDAWREGAVAHIEVTAEGQSGIVDLALAPGERTFTTTVRLPSPGGPRTIDVRLKLSAAGESTSTLNGQLHLEGPGLLRPLLFRRGPTTGNRLVPAAFFLFNRTERIHLELPLTAGAPSGGTARLLDRTAKPVAIPVTAAERTDDAGQRWMIADLTLAPLGAGDYAIELTTGSERKIVTAIRVTR